MRRILSHDPDEMMPPPAANKPLSEQKKRILRDWIAAGAAYKPHWAFVPPRQAVPPSVRDAALAAKPDRPFHSGPAGAGGPEAGAGSRPVHARPPRVARSDRSAAHAGGGRRVRQRSSRPTPTSGWSIGSWPRRITGSAGAGAGWIWPATPTRTVTKRTASRSIWPYRDWVIAAINADMPFDQFTIKQLAGDMLPRRDGFRPDRHRLSPQHDAQRRGGHRSARVPLLRDGRSRQHDGRRLAGPDRRLCAVPHAQVRSDPASRLLPHDGRS